MNATLTDDESNSDNQSENYNLDSEGIVWHLLMWLIVSHVRT